MAQKTFKQVMAIVAWSWKVLFDGVCPKKDWQGKRRGVLWSITGDLEWFCQEFGFPGQSIASRILGLQPPGEKLYSPRRTSKPSLPTTPVESTRGFYPLCEVRLVTHCVPWGGSLPAWFFAVQHSGGASWHQQIFGKSK